MAQEEFSKIYNENIDKIFRFFYLRVNSQETAQDLTAQVFLKFFEKKISFVQGEKVEETKKNKVLNPRAFLFKMARNQLIDFYRRKERRNLSLENLDIDVPDTGISGKIFSEKLEISWEMEQVIQALQKLNPLYADIVTWRYLDDLSFKEISQILNKKEGTVRVSLQRAMAALKKQLNS